MRKLRLCLAAALFLGFGRALAAPGQPIEIEGNPCAEAAARMERVQGLPRHLLNAISLAESGRWDAARRENIAWPWTVTAGGEGEYFATKQAAIARVRALQAAGVANIDVGCMQINLMYHPGAFADLEEAFDPPSNAAYAAHHLKTLYAAAGSWSEAVAAYHTSDRLRGRAYKLRVLGLWQRARRDGGAPSIAGSGAQPRRAAAATVRTAFATTPEPHALVVAPRHYRKGIDGARTRALNARLRRTRDDARKLDKAMKRHQELQNWRLARVQGMDAAHFAAMRRAQAKLRQKLKYAAIGKTDFAAQRRQQLAEWRRRNGRS